MSAGRAPTVPKNGPLPRDAAAWARRIRAGFALNETEGVTLRLAEQMLTVALDEARPVSDRTAAARTWQALLKQLDLQEASDDGEATSTSYPRLA